MASAPSTLTVPITLTVNVHEIDGGGFYGEVRQLPAASPRPTPSRSSPTPSARPSATTSPNPAS